MTQESYVQSSMDTLVWVRQKDDCWWPGVVLYGNEYSSSTSKSRTPVKLLGCKQDSSVEWYNVGKSRCIKAFRCGDFDTCIERARLLSCDSFETEDKRATRENAILHALDIEKKQLEELIQVEHPLRETSQGASHSLSNVELMGSISGYSTAKLCYSFCPSIGSLPELSHPAASTDASSSRRAVPSTDFELEDSSHIQTRRMRDLKDIGLQISTSKKRGKKASSGFTLLHNGTKSIASFKSSRRMKSRTMAMAKTTRPAKRRKKKRTVVSSKGKHKALAQVLEKSKIQCTAEGLERLHQSNMSDSTLTCLSDTVEAKSSHETCRHPDLELGSKVDHKRAKRQNVSYPQRHGTEMELKKQLSCGKSSRRALHSAEPYSTVLDGARWQTKRCRNARKRVYTQVCKTNNDATNFGCKKTTSEAGLIICQKSTGDNRSGYVNSLMCSKQLRSTRVKNWFPVGLHFDYAQKNNSGRYISIMSEMTGKPIIGFSVSVEVLGNTSEAGEHVMPTKVSRTNVSSRGGLTVGPHRKLKSQKHSNAPSSFQKTRSLSSIAGSVVSSSKWNTTEHGLRDQHKESRTPIVTCIPVHTVFDRIREALS